MVHLLLVFIYISFISLGLPDGLLGSAWPSMYENLAVPVSFAGIISMVISGCTILSALFSERLVKKLGTGGVTVISVAMTAIALFGFSTSTEFWQLCLWSIPYGLGAGSVDAALNNYVAVHYKSRHMSWLHCFWGVGCSCGPYVMSYFLTRGESWSSSYISVFLLQAVLTAVLLFSLPLWRKKSVEISGESSVAGEVLGLKRTIAISGVKEMMITFLCYCAIEQTTSLWAVSYIVFEKEIASDKAAGLGALFFLGITIGRFLCGFLTAKYSDKQMVRIGIVILAAGIFTLFLPIGNIGAIVGLFLIGFGCAPVYPCLIHATPAYFGAEKSQAVIGVQMASAYVGSTLMPPLFGMLADHISIALLPVYDLCIVAIGNDFQSSLETTSLLKELGAKVVISRASRDTHAKFLLRNGADQIIYPEKQVASWAAIRYSADHILDFIEIDERFAIFEVTTPEEWIGKTIGQIDIRKKFGINIMAIKQDGKMSLIMLVDVDARLIVQVIINIVDNAIKYTPKGSEITISTQKNDKMLSVSIADNGNGITDGIKDKVFDMFYTGANKIADSRRSLGLGLALCKTIISAHGGEITVSDNNPHGAVFTFTLPVKEVDINE